MIMFREIAPYLKMFKNCDVNLASSEMLVNSNQYNTSKW